MSYLLETLCVFVFVYAYVYVCEVQLEKWLNFQCDSAGLLALLDAYMSGDSESSSSAYGYGKIYGFAGLRLE